MKKTIGNIKGGSVQFWQNAIIMATSAIVAADFLYNVGLKKNEEQTVDEYFKKQVDKYDPKVTNPKIIRNVNKIFSEALCLIFLIIL